MTRTLQRPAPAVLLHQSSHDPHETKHGFETTVNLPDELLREAQELARRQATTLKELIEAGLRTVVKQHAGHSRFQLDDASVEGRGLQPEFRGAPWEQIRDAIYKRPE